MASEVDEPKTLAVVRARVASRPDALWEQLGRRDGSETPSAGYRRLRLATLDAERAEVLKIRSTGKVDHEVIDEVLSTLDIEESMLTIAAQRSERLLDVRTHAGSRPGHRQLRAPGRARGGSWTPPGPATARTAYARTPARCTCGCA